MVDLTESDGEEETLTVVRPARRKSVERMVGFFENLKEKEDFFAETPTPATKKKRKKYRSSPELTSPNLRERKKKKDMEEVKRKFYTAMSAVLPGELMVPVTEERMQHLNQSESREVDRMTELHNQLNLTNSNGQQD